MKLKLLNIILFAGLLLASKACIMIFCCQSFSVNEINTSADNIENYNIVNTGSLTGEPNILNLPGLKVEQIQIRVENDQTPFFTINKNSEKDFFRKYAQVPDKFNQFVQRNLQISFLRFGVLLI